MTLPVPIRTLLLAFVTGALAAPLPAQSTPSPGAQVARAVDSMVFKAHLEVLADDALEGRAPGTRGGLLAQKYIAAQFERLGTIRNELDVVGPVGGPSPPRAAAPAR